MNTSQGADSNDRIFCWEQVTRTNPAFRVSQVFAAREDAERLLPLYALFAIVEQICSASSDEDLARRKLDWWRIECAPQNICNSHHPVLKEFQRTAVADRLDPSLLKALFDSAESRLGAQAPADISALKDICINTQRPQCDLEVSVCGLGENSLKTSTGLLARGGFFQLLRESANQLEQGAYWWIPMNLLARYAISRDVLAGHPVSEEASGLMTELIGEGGSWGSSLEAPEKQSDIDALRNYCAINGLYANKINRLKGISPSLYTREFRRIRVSDLFVAWRSARRLQV